MENIIAPLTKENAWDEFTQFPQLKDWDCGPAIYATIQAKFGIKIKDWDTNTQSWQKIVKKLKATEALGTPHFNFSPALTKDNIPHKEIDNCSIPYLTASLEHGHFFLVDYQSVVGAEVTDLNGDIITDYKHLRRSGNFAWGHYALIVGQTDDDFILLEPDADKPLDGLPVGYRKIPKDIFENRWFDSENHTPFSHWAIEFKSVESRNNY